jgi:hypothetical protein
MKYHLIKALAASIFKFLIKRVAILNSKLNKMKLTYLFLILNIICFSQPNQGDLFLIIKNDKYGYINNSGQIVISPQYDYANDFNNEGTAIVVKNRESYLINKKAEKVSASYQLMQQRKTVIETTNGGQISDFYGRNSVSNGKTGFIDFKGKVIIESGKYEKIGWRSYGLAFEHTDIEEIKYNGKYGMINNRGQILIEPIYDDIEISDYLGYAKVKFNNKFGIIDFNGNISVPINYSDINGPYNYYFSFAKNEKESFLINRHGQVVKIFPSKIRGKCEDGVCFLADYDIKKIALCDTFGNAITPFMFDKVGDFKKNELASFADLTQNKLGFINRKGEIVVPAKYEIERYISHYPSEDFIVVKKQNKLGFVDYKGATAIEFKFDKATDFDKGYSVVSMNNKFGLINKKGSFIIEAVYDSLEYDSDNLLCKIVQGKSYNKRKIGVFSIKTNKIIIEAKFDEIDFIENKYIRGKYIISTDPPVINRFGLYNMEGGEILPPIYNSISIIKDLIRVVYRYEGSIQDKQISYLNTKGAWIYQ